MSKDVQEEVPVEEEPKKEEEGEADAEKTEEEKEDGEEADADITDEDEKDPAAEPEKKTKTVTKQVWDWELINHVKPIWLQEKSEISEEQYNEFYKAVSKDTNEPLAHSHF